MTMAQLLLLSDVDTEMLGGKSAPTEPQGTPDDIRRMAGMSNAAA